jgi:hypothetical protein
MAIAYDSPTTTYDGAYTYDGDAAVTAPAVGGGGKPPFIPMRVVTVGPTAQQRDDEDVLLAVM